MSSSLHLEFTKEKRSILYVRVLEENKEFLEKKADEEGVSTSALVDMLFSNFKKYELSKRKKETALKQEPSKGKSHDRPKTRLRKRNTQTH